MPIFCFKSYSLNKELLILKNIPIIFNYLTVSHACLQFTTFKTLINFKPNDLDFGHK